MRLIVGLGTTGLSVARHLAARGERFAVTDSRSNPPGLEALHTAQAIPTVFGEFAAPCDLAEITEAILSPGVDLREPFVRELQAANIPIVGDIELFVRQARAPIVGITGSNGKSTVTTLLGEMAKAAALRVAVGGNLGTPALDLLADDVALYVLELSSFQLDTVQSLKCAAATVLNVSDDHLDRHGNFEAYAAAKAHIYHGCDTAVVNRDDVVTLRDSSQCRVVTSFGLNQPTSGDWGLVERDSGWWLAQGGDALLPVAEMKLPGLHNAANALAALALGTAVGLPREAMLRTLRTFAGLPHRCAWVAEIAGVTYYNDSKGTNVGATLAALSGLQCPVVLLAGGQGKGGDFRPWRAPLAEKGRGLILFGEDAARIGNEVGDVVPQYPVQTLHDAVQQAAAIARPGDCVLLSPGCASFDMFKGYADRGAQFEQAVKRLNFTATAAEGVCN